MTITSAVALAARRAVHNAAAATIGAATATGRSSRADQRSNRVSDEVHQTSGRNAAQ